MAKFVKLGPKASCFRDTQFDITLAPGEVIELNVMELNSPHIKRALNGGHLVYTDDPKAAKVETKTELTAEELYEAFKDMVTKGKEPNKIIKAFDLKAFKEMAKLNDIEVEDSDTKQTIYEALVEDLKNA